MLGVIQAATGRIGPRLETPPAGVNRLVTCFLLRPILGQSPGSRVAPLIKKYGSERVGDGGRETLEGEAPRTGDNGCDRRHDLPVSAAGSLFLSGVQRPV